VRTKHIEVHYHYIRERLLQGEIELCHVASRPIRRCTHETFGKINILQI
jgi:hypothetical protein